MRVMMYGKVYQYLFECSRKYLLAMGIAKPQAYIVVVSTFIHFINLLIFVGIYRYGVVAIAIINCVTLYLRFLMISIFIAYTKFRGSDNYMDSISYINLESFKEIPKYLRYGLPSGLMLLIEWGAYEVMVLYAGWIDSTALATQSIICNYVDLLFMITLSISYASVSFIGNSLGENKPNKAKRYTVANYLCGWLLTSTITPL